MSAPNPVPGLALPSLPPVRPGPVSAVRGPASRPLPLPVLPPPLSPGRTFYALTSIGGNGRLNDRSVPRRLGWSSGTRLGIQEDRGLIVVVADPRGVFRVTVEGFLLVPAPARRWCGLVAGDRVFLAADPVDGWMVLHPPAAVDAMVAAAHRAVWGGEGA